MSQRMLCVCALTCNLSWKLQLQFALSPSIENVLGRAIYFLYAAHKSIFYCLVDWRSFVMTRIVNYIQARRVMLYKDAVNW